VEKQKDVTGALRKRLYPDGGTRQYSIHYPQFLHVGDIKENESPSYKELQSHIAIRGLERERARRLSAFNQAAVLGAEESRARPGKERKRRSGASRISSKGNTTS